MTSHTEQILYNLTCKDIGNIIYQNKLQMEHLEKLEHIMEDFLISYSERYTRYIKHQSYNHNVKVSDFINYYNEIKNDVVVFKIEHIKVYDMYKKTKTITNIKTKKGELFNNDKYFGEHMIEGFTYQGRTRNLCKIYKIHTSEKIDDGLKNRIKRKIQYKSRCLIHYLLTTAISR